VAIVHVHGFGKEGALRGVGVGKGVGRTTHQVKTRGEEPVITTNAAVIRITGHVAREAGGGGGGQPGGGAVHVIHAPADGQPRCRYAVEILGEGDGEGVTRSGEAEGAHPSAHVRVIHAAISAHIEVVGGAGCSTAPGVGVGAHIVVG